MFSNFPVAPAQAELHFSIFMSPKAQAKRKESYWKANRRPFASALVEELAIQRNLHSGAKRQQTFGKFEKALGWYHHDIDKAML